MNEFCYLAHIFAFCIPELGIRRQGSVSRGMNRHLTLFIDRFGEDFRGVPKRVTRVGGEDRALQYGRGV